MNVVTIGLCIVVLNQERLTLNSVIMSPSPTHWTNPSERNLSESLFPQNIHPPLLFTLRLHTHVDRN